MSKVPTQTVGQLLMAESVVEGTAGAHSPLYDLARHASQDCRKLVDFLLKRDFTLVAPAICATVASPPRVEAFVRLMKKWGKRTEIHRAVVTAILPDLEEHALMKQSVISKLLAVKAARRWCYKLAECSRAMSRVLRQLIGVKKRLTMSERADKYVAKVMAHRRGEIRMGESESDSDSQKSTSSDSDDMDAPMGKDPRRVQRLEKELGAFVADSRRTAHSLRPMRRAERRKTHAVCEVYGVGTRSYDRSPERHIRILREPGAPAPSLPDVLLSEAAALPAVSVLPEPAPALPEAPPSPPKPPRAPPRPPSYDQYVHNRPHAAQTALLGAQLAQEDTGAVDRLAAMGFSRRACEAALLNAGQDETAAVELLLTRSTEELLGVTV